MREDLPVLSERVDPDAAPASDMPQDPAVLHERIDALAAAAGARLTQELRRSLRAELQRWFQGEPPRGRD